MCFESITVSSPEAVAAGVQAARMGTYTKVANATQGERPVYQRVGSTVAYLFYWPSTAEWRIGSNYTSGTSGVKSTGGAGAACPDQATGWEVVAGGRWVSTYPITVVLAAGQTRPPSLPTTAPPTSAGKRSCYVRMRSSCPALIM